MRRWVWRGLSQVTAGIGGVLSVPSGGAGLFVALSLLLLLLVPRAVVDAAPALACGPRPNVRVSALLQEDGRQLATVTAGAGEVLQSLAFGADRPLQNAAIDIGSDVGRTGTFTINLPANPTVVSFLIRPLQPSGGAVTVHFVVRTSCGSTPLFVGGGSGVPFGGSITGRVTNACNGLPVANALVRVKGNNLSTVTDTSGNYRAYGPLGPQTLEISAPGFTTGAAEIAVQRGSSAVQPVALTGPTGTVTGQISRAGSNPAQPLQLAQVAVQGTALKGTAVTAAAIYTIADVPTGQQTLVTTLAGTVPDTRTVTVCPGTNTVNIGLVPAVGGVAGTVLDVCGHAIDRTRVFHVQSGAVTNAGPGGTFSFPVIPAGAQSFRFEAAGYTTTTRTATVPIQATVTIPTVTLSGGKGNIRVTVVDTDGFGVVGADVRVQATGQTATTGNGGLVLMFDVAADPNGDGRPVTLVASKSGLPASTTSVRICPGLTVDATVTIAANVGTVRATVVQDCNGAALANAVSTIQPTGPSGTSDGTGLVTVLDVPLGTQSLVTSKQNFTNDTRSVSPIQGQVVDLGTIRLAGGRAVVTVVLRSRLDNTPVTNATVTISGTGLTATNLGSGQFSFPNVPANTQSGLYALSISANGYFDKTIVSQHFCDGPNDMGTVLLDPIITRGIFTGTVRDCGNLSIVKDALVTVDGFPALDTHTDAAGAFTIREVPAGTHTIRISKSGYGTWALEGQVMTAGQTIDLGRQALCPQTAGNSIQFVLSWDTDKGGPRDIDLHMSMPEAAGGRFHLWFRFPNNAKNVCEGTLDSQDVTPAVDDSASEIITLRGIRSTTTGLCDGAHWVAGRYTIWAHNWSLAAGESGPFHLSNGSLVVLRNSQYVTGRHISQTLVDHPADPIWILGNFDIDANGNFVNNPPSITTTGIPFTRDGTKDTVF